jgi:pimeloyl-ACP methyl ester carboxylesterase
MLSPGGFVPVARQFSLRGMLMLFFPTRFTVNSFMRWLGFIDAGARPVLNLMYLGLKHFRLPPETLRVLSDVVPDDQLREMHVATLLLMGDREVMFDAATALARAYRLISNVEANLVPRSSHDMCFSQHRIVDARILNFLRKTRTDDQGKTTERSVA